MKRTKTWLARSIAALAVAAAVALGATTLFVVDRRPRTHDAHLFAYSAGMAPEVSGRVLALHVINNQRVNAGEPLVDIDPGSRRRSMAPMRRRRRSATHASSSRWRRTRCTARSRFSPRAT